MCGRSRCEGIGRPEVAKLACYKQALDIIPMLSAIADIMRTLEGVKTTPKVDK